MTHTPSTSVENPPEPSDLAVAVCIAERMLNTRNDIGTREALRLLLRAVRGGVA